MQRKFCPQPFSNGSCRQPCNCCELVNQTTSFGVCEEGLIRGQGGALRVGTFDESTLVSKGKDSTALGQDTQATGEDSFAVGLQSIALTPQSAAFGNNSLSYLPASMALQSQRDRTNGDVQNLRFTSRGQLLQDNFVTFQIGTPGVPITLPFLGKAYVEVSIVGSLTTGGKVSFTVDNNGVAYTSTVPQLVSGTVTNPVILPSNNGFQLLVEAAVDGSGAFEKLTATFDMTMVSRVTLFRSDSDQLTLGVSRCGPETFAFSVQWEAGLIDGFYFGINAFVTGTSTPAPIADVSFAPGYSNVTPQIGTLTRQSPSWVQGQIAEDDLRYGASFTINLLAPPNTTVYFTGQLKKPFFESDIYKNISCP